MKKSNYKIQFTILLVSLILTQTAFADVKIKARQTISGQTSENTTYIKGKRQRTEMANGQMISITQCDLRRGVTLNPLSKTYMVNLFDTAESRTERSSTTAGKTRTTVENGGMVTTTVTNKDTGERKQMFGYTARHIITTMVTESSPESCTKQNSKMEIDGWYIDAAFVLDCDYGTSYRGYQGQNGGGCQDKYQYKSAGAPNKGYPVLTKTTMFDESGKASYTMTNEVVELSKTTLENALFDVPSDYREAKNSTEMYASMTNNGGDTSDYSAANNSSGVNSGLNSNVKNLANKTQGNSAQVGAKKEGVIRIGLAAVKTGAVGDGISATELAGAIQNTLTEYLKSPNVEVVQLESKLATAIDAEAKQKECDYVIYANVSHKKGGGGGMFGKVLGNIAGSAISQVGYGTGSVAGTVVGQAASQAVYTAAGASSNVKSKDEITLDVRLNTPGNTSPALSKQVKAKAKSNGEDIISPLIEQVAQAILDAAKK